VCVSARVRACVYVSVRVRVLISCAASGPAVHVCCRAAGHAGAAVRLRARLTMGALLRTLIRFCVHVCVCLGQWVWGVLAQPAALLRLRPALCCEGSAWLSALPPSSQASQRPGWWRWVHFPPWVFTCDG